jgi:hypothetical protein
MANPEHLKILKQGVEVWNKWLSDNPERPDFSGADLSNIDLSNVDFFMGDISGADLSGTNLSGATLEDADLTYSRLTGAELRGANLIAVKLQNADLRSAILYWANLSYANLQGAMLDGAKFSATVLGGTDLNGAIGLDACEHFSESVINVETLTLCKDLPLNFLRGCGLPDTLIEFLPSLLSDPIQFYSCFISYSSKDQDFANRLYADLQNKGVRCWFAPEDLKIGDKIRDRIDESIRLRDKLLLILSENSIASDWVEHEVESALEEEGQRGRTILFPIRLDDAVMKSNKAWAALIRRTRHIGDFTGWKDHDSYQKAFDRLLRDLKANA